MTILILQKKTPNTELTGLVNEELTFSAALPVRSIIMIFLPWRRSVNQNGDRQPRSQLVPRFLSVSRVEHEATGRGREGRGGEGREDNVESQASSYIFVACAACRRRKGQRIERKGEKEGDWDSLSRFSPCPSPFCACHIGYTLAYLKCQQTRPQQQTNEWCRISQCRSGSVQLNL